MYGAPAGWHWGSRAEVAAIMGGGEEAREPAKDYYYEEGGWDEYTWGGVYRVCFLFSDSLQVGENLCVGDGEEETDNKFCSATWMAKNLPNRDFRASSAWPTESPNCTCIAVSLYQYRPCGCSCARSFCNKPPDRMIVPLKPWAHICSSADGEAGVRVRRQLRHLGCSSRRKPVVVGGREWKLERELDRDPDGGCCGVMTTPCSCAESALCTSSLARYARPRSQLTGTKNRQIEHTRGTWTPH